MPTTRTTSQPELRIEWSTTALGCYLPLITGVTVVIIYWTWQIYISPVELTGGRWLILAGFAFSALLAASVTVVVLKRFIKAANGEPALVVNSRGIYDYTASKGGKQWAWHQIKGVERLITSVGEDSDTWLVIHLHSGPTIKLNEINLSESAHDSVVAIGQARQRWGVGSW